MPVKKRIFKTALILVCYLAVWEGASLAVGSVLLLPGPYETIARLLGLLASGESWRYAALTLLRVMAGYLLGVGSGVCIAALCARFSFAKELLAPLKSVVKATPVTSFILLAILWMRSDSVPVFISFLMVLPIVWTNTLEGIMHTDVQLLEAARVFRFGRWRTFRNIYLPSVAPSLLAACTTSLGFAWKSGVAAEIIALPKRSIGYRLYEAKLGIETVDLFAWTVLIVLLSMLIERVLVAALRRLAHD